MCRFNDKNDEWCGMTTKARALAIAGPLLIATGCMAALVAGGVAGGVIQGERGAAASPSVNVAADAPARIDRGG